MQKTPTPSLLKAILLGGLLAALLDILDPIVFFYLRNRIAPIRIPQSIASGLLGRAAFSGATHTALIGLALHLGIALAWTTGFVLTARVLPFLTLHPIRSGLLYGAFIYMVMNYLVLPHSKVTPSRPTPGVLINGIFAILVLVGLPISLANRRFAPYPQS
jgi:integral membrane sensor domain MASE1